MWRENYSIFHTTVQRLEENKISQPINFSINPNSPLSKQDKRMLEQIIYNLLNNAALYSKPDSCKMLCAVGVHNCYPQKSAMVN